jgi:histidine triad (HIT) family protein
MPSIFTRIITGESPGRIVYRDDQCVALLSITPLKPGHTLVVPIQEVDHWIDLSPDLAAHLIHVAQKVARAIQQTYQPQKVGLMIAGLEVRHVHLHLVPIDSVYDLDFAKQDREPDAEMLDEAMVKLRGAMRT